MAPEEQELYFYYVGMFVFVSVITVGIRFFLNVAKTVSTATTSSKLTTAAAAAGNNSLITRDTLLQHTPAEYLKFRSSYLTVYFLMVAADWLQGPYVYALYASYGYSIVEIGYLFIVGFASSMLVGTVVGAAADRYGRKHICLLFGLLYALSCISKHSSQWRWLMTGRVLGGVATSILYSSFESWLVYTHNHNHSNNSNSNNNNSKQEAQHAKAMLDTTFAIAGMGNSVVAIAAGIVASTARERFGAVAPFDVSLICLVIGTVCVATMWTNDHTTVTQQQQQQQQQQQPPLLQTLKNGWSAMMADSRIWLLGLVQSFFEGAMYVFVFMWTPALESSATMITTTTAATATTAAITTHTPQLFHGWIFASFMVCAFLGSTLFEYAAVKQQQQHIHIMLLLLCVAVVSMIVPVVATSSTPTPTTAQHTIRLLSFFVFEVCVGVFWPTVMSLREIFITRDEVRATIMNLFRLPLNAIVIVVLINIGSLSEREVFACCGGCLMVAVGCCYGIMRQMEVQGAGGASSSGTSSSSSSKSQTVHVLLKNSEDNGDSEGDAHLKHDNSSHGSDSPTLQSIVDIDTPTSR